ncbi:hypothetical protein [Streptomyces sp. NPDC000851]
MTPNEITFLISGIAIGTHLMILMNAYWAWRDDRRDRAASRQARRRAAGDRYLSSFRLYRLENRSRV